MAKGTCILPIFLHSTLESIYPYFNLFLYWSSGISYYQIKYLVLVNTTHMQSVHHMATIQM